MALNSTTVNAQMFQKQPKKEVMGLRQLSRELMMSEYTVAEYPGLVLKFLHGGILQVKGKESTPRIYRYTLAHTEGVYRMTTAPHLLNEPCTMDMKIMKNHMTLSNTDGTEIIHLNKIKICAYDNSK